MTISRSHNLAEQRSELVVRTQQLSKLNAHTKEQPPTSMTNNGDSAIQNDNHSLRTPTRPQADPPPDPATSALHSYVSHNGNSPLHLVNNMLHLVKARHPYQFIARVLIAGVQDLEKRLSSYSSITPLCSPYSSPYSSPYRLSKSSRTERSTPQPLFSLSLEDGTLPRTSPPASPTRHDQAVDRNVL